MAHTSRASGVSHAKRPSTPEAYAGYGVQGATDDAEIAMHSQGPAEGYSGLCRDDLTGQVLKDSLVIEARRVELAFFHSKGVGTKLPLAMAK